MQRRKTTKQQQQQVQDVTAQPQEEEVQQHSEFSEYEVEALKLTMDKMKLCMEDLEDKNQRLIQEGIVRHATISSLQESVSYTHITLPTNRDV